MIFSKTPIDGAMTIELDRKEDARGFFARLWCRDEFAAHGIAVDMVQASISHNLEAGTLRGMHFQWPPSTEGKLVRCARGRVHDVIVDLRPSSPSFLAHVAVTLDAARHNAIFIPPGCAHGFLTLEPDCDVVYMMSDVFRPELSDGVRHDDPAFGIVWPRAVTRIVERDRTYPDFDRARHVQRYGVPA